MTHKKEYMVVMKGDTGVLAVLKSRVPKRPSLREAREFGRAVEVIFGDDVEIAIQSVGRGEVKVLKGA